MAPSSQQQGATSAPAQQPASLTGSLTHPGDDKADGRIQALQSRQHADALIVLRKWLREAVRADADAAMPSMRFKPGQVICRLDDACKLTLADLQTKSSPADQAPCPDCLQIEIVRTGQGTELAGQSLENV